MTLTANDASVIEDAVSSLCDRRRSRAARELLRLHLIRTWDETSRILSSSTSSKTSSSKDHDTYSMDVTEWNVWQLLDATIVPTNDNDSHRPVNDVANLPICPLMPQYDMLKEHEESYSIFDTTGAIIPQRYRNSAIPGILHHQRTGPNHGSKSKPSQQQYQQLYPLIYHCDLCQKSFISQYYLDQHLITKHPITPPISSDRICPADIYCSFLSPIVCDDYIMRHEPYYGPGHFVAADVSTGNLKYTATKMTCDDQEQQKAIQRCHEIVALCFDESIRNGGATGTSAGNTFGQILSTSMCGTIPNCQTRLVDNVMTTISRSAKNILQHSYLYMHHPYSIYDHHTTSTWMALLIVTFIFILVFGHYIYQLFLAILQKQRNEQHCCSTEPTIIHHPPTSARMIVQPPTTYIVPTKTKLT